MTTEYTARQLEEIEHHTHYDWPFDSWIVDDSVFPRKYAEYLDVIDQYYPSASNRLKGMRVLDCGCGFGAISVVLVQRGAQVEAFDISPHMVEITERLARENQVHESVRVQQCAMENMDYPAESFDLVVGTTVLHHVDIPAVAVRLNQVLKPGGRAIFWEPIVRSRLRETLRKLYRRLFPFFVPGTSEEHPMLPEEIDILVQQVGKLSMRPCYFSPLTVIASKVLPKKLYRRSKPKLEKVDSTIDRVFPFLRKLESDHILVFEKPGASA